MYVKVTITQEREVIDSPLALGWIISSHKVHLLWY